MYIHNQFSLDIVCNVVEEQHFHSELEVLYVLDGQIDIKVKDKSWIMEKDDVIVIDSGVQHSVNGREKSIICFVKYDYQVLADVISQSGCIFLCNSCADPERDYGEVRQTLRKLIYEEILHTKKTKSYKYSLFYHLLNTLIENYMITSFHMNPEEYDADEKLRKVIHYIHQNYQDGLNLSDLAEQMYISTSTLSRFFKKQTGIYFAEYVSQIRMKYAINEMLYSDKNITKIALDCGFSNASAFNKVFRENFGCPPKEYRLQMLDDLKIKREKEDRLKQVLCLEIQEKMTSLEETEQADLMTTVIDAMKTVPYQKSWNKAINIGGFFNLTKANIQFHLLYLVEHLGFTHARIWSIFCNKLMLTDGKTIGVYNYDMMDTVFDFLVQHHIKPWLSFNIKPDTAVRSAGKSVWFEENDIRFASRQAWEVCFEELIKHLVRRYGKEELEGWIFEIGMNPFGKKKGEYYEDPDYDFWNVYQFAYKTLKEQVPGAEMGGPEAISNADIMPFERFLDKCKQTGCIPDFISFDLFPYIPKMDASNKDIPYIRCPDPDFEVQQIMIMKNLMKKVGLEECKLYISEWNNTLSNRNYFNDSCFRGLYVCKKITEILNLVDVICLWTGSDWISSYYDSYSIANGGSGLLTKEGIRKPVFFAISFLNKMADLLVAKGKNYIVTKAANGSFEVLCFNFNWYSVNFFLEEEDTKQPYELDSVMVATHDLSIHIILEHVMDNCEYMIRKQTVNKEHGSFLDEWKAFQYEKELERRDVKYLQEICVPNMGMERIRSCEGRLNLNFNLKKQEFAIYHISPISK